MKQFSRSAVAVFAVGLVVLGGAIALQVLKLRDLSAGDLETARAAGRLKDAVPLTISGWQGRDEPLGPTELVAGQVQAMLNYDDYVFRIFTKGSAHVGVYVAYWQRDRMPVSRVASHTPDRCWTENGWTCEQMKFNQTWTVNGWQWQPGQWRLFKSPANTRETVVFWHLVNGRAFDFGERFTLLTHPGKWLRDTLKYAALGSEEQYFIRITSSGPFEELSGDAGWNELLAALAKLGLAEKAAPANG